MFRAQLHLPHRRQGANEDPFGVCDLSFSRRLDRCCGAIRGNVPQLLAQDGGINPQLLRDLVGQFVANNTAGHALDVRQKIIDCLDLALGITDRKLRAGAFDQIGKVRLGVTQRILVSVFALAPDVQVGIEALLES